MRPMSEAEKDQVAEAVLALVTELVRNAHRATPERADVWLTRQDRKLMERR